MKPRTSQAKIVLTEYRTKGFLFHGSPSSELTQLEPREAKDSDPSRKFNFDKAVFAADDPASAVIFAVMPSRDTKGVGSGRWTVYFNRGETPPVAEIPSKWKKLVQGGSGYVYVLPRDTFEGRGGQYKSKTAVSSVDRVLVRFEDYEALGGVIKWKKETEHVAVKKSR